MTDQELVDYLQDVESKELVEDYLEDLWFTLHHSDGENCLVLGLRHYLDDSGSDDGSPMATCGGPVMSRIDFKAFSGRWAKMYERNRRLGNYILEPPLHMSDFTGTGKYAGLYAELKRALFMDVARIIRDHKFYSLSIAISQAEFDRQLSQEVKSSLIGPYAFAFFALILANQEVSKIMQTGPFKVSYLVDQGFGHYDQLVEAHRVIVRFELSPWRL